MSIGNKADYLMDRISDIEDGNLEMTQRERDWSIKKKKKKLYENYLTLSEE